MTGNGHDDLVAIDRTGNMWLYPSRKDGSFEQKTHIGSKWTSMRLVDGVDVTGDGLADIVAVRSDGKLLLYVNKGKGELKAGVQVGWGWNSARDIAAVSRGPNGRPALYALFGETLQLYQTKRNGRFTKPVQVGTNGQDIVSIDDARNIDGNHGSDLIAKTRDNKIYLYLSQSAPTAPKSYRIGYGFSGYRTAGVMRVDGTYHFRSINSKGMLRSWTIQKPGASQPKWASPVPSDARMTARFGRYPGGGQHNGTDYAKFSGKFNSACTGTVSEVRIDKKYPNSNTFPTSGTTNHLWVDCGGGITMQYGHWMAKDKPSSIAVGTRVVAGQPLIQVGNQGYSTGTHLHFEVKRNGQRIDGHRFLEARGVRGLPAYYNY
ncbi:MAG: FG-GAP-like repeat-containing protein [Propioniciclava sp.]